MGSCYGCVLVKVVSGYDIAVLDCRIDYSVSLD